MDVINVKVHYVKYIMLHFFLVSYKEKDFPVKLGSRPKLLVGIINSQYWISILSLLVPQGKILAN